MVLICCMLISGRNLFLSFTAVRGNSQYEIYPRKKFDVSLNPACQPQYLWAVMNSSQRLDGRSPAVDLNTMNTASVTYKNCVMQRAGHRGCLGQPQTPAAPARPGRARQLLQPGSLCSLVQGGFHGDPLGSAPGKWGRHRLGCELPRRPRTATWPRSAS